MAQMRSIVGVLCCVLLCCSVSAQPEVSSPAMTLLDHLTGAWVLQGMLSGKPTTHDVQAAWVLNHEYLQLHEVSREKDASGRPKYEAIIYLEWNATTRQYTCLWLDSTEGGGLSSKVRCHAKQSENSIPFIFSLSGSDQIHTTFSFDKATDSWQWLIDNVVNGQIKRFATLSLRRSR